MSGEYQTPLPDGRSDPFGSIAGLGNSDDTDLSQRVDEVLYRSPAGFETL